MPLSVPSQDTFSVGQILTAASMNKNVRDAVGFLVARPWFFGYQAASQNIASSSTVAIAFDTNVVDTYSGHSTVTNNSRYTAQVAGWYRCIGRISLPSNATGSRNAIFRVNGTSNTQSQVRYPPVSGASTTYLAEVPLFLNAGDYVEMAAFQTSGSTLATNANESTFEVLWEHS